MLMIRIRVACISWNYLVLYVMELRKSYVLTYLSLSRITEDTLKPHQTYRQVKLTTRKVLMKYNVSSTGAAIGCAAVTTVASDLFFLMVFQLFRKRRKTVTKK